MFSRVPTFHVCDGFSAISVHAVKEQEAQHSTTFFNVLDVAHLL